MKAEPNFNNLLRTLSVAAILFLASCSGKDEGGIKTETPKQAATTLDQAFQNANPGVKQNVTAAAEAMRNEDYEKAIASLHTVKQAEGITLEQGMAIQGSVISLERTLINAIERGDKNAEKAYQLLKRMNRN